MRIAISGAAGIAALFFATSAAAQGDKPEPLPVLPTMPGAKAAQPVVSSGAPVATTPAVLPAAPPPPVPATPAPKTPPAKSKGPAHPDAPPPPPPAGLAPPPPAPATGPLFAADPSLAAVKDPPLAGWHGSFYLRDPGDYFRLYPRGRLNLDFNTWPGAPTGAAKDGGTNLQPRFYARRLRLELAGQFLQRWTFHLGADFGGQPIANATGNTEQLGGAAGPTAASARVAPLEPISGNALPADLFVNYAVCDCLNFMVGQHDVAFSMDNQTNDNVSSLLERNMAIGSFVVPSKKEIGLTIWGELFDERLAYAFEVLLGDGQNRFQVDSSADFSGRVFARPLLGSKSPLEKLQFGVSARTGQRNPAFVQYDHPAIATTQGYALWTPLYNDSQGRTVHVLPSGSQNAIGGELRLPISIFDLRAEAYYVVNGTREAVEGSQTTNTERFGQMSGVGWYVQASAWPLGDKFINGDPGFLRPTTVQLNKELERPRRGFEVVALVGGVNADYQGNSRLGLADANTATAQTGSKIDVFQYGLGINYWYTKNLRAAINYSIYHTPGSGSDASNAAAPDPIANRAVVPANLGATGDPNEHLLHELGTRLSIWF